MKLFNIFIDRNLHPKLKTQLILSFIGMNAIILSIISISVYFGVLGILKSQSEEMVTQQSRQAEFNLTGYREQIENVAGMIAINSDVQNFINADGNRELPTRVTYANDIIKQFDGIISTYNFIDSIYLYCPNGEALSTSYSGCWYRQDALTKCAFYSTKLYREILEKGYGSIWEGGYSAGDFEVNDYNSLSSGTPYITMIRNISFLSSSRQKAVVVVNLKQNSVISIYNGITGEKRTDKYMIKSDGTVISNTETKLIGSRVDFVEKINAGGKHGSFRIERDDVPKQVTYYKLSNTGWVLINEIPESDFIDNILTLKRIVLGVFAISLVFALLLSTYWIYRITKPFNHLTEAMKKMGGGDIGILLDENPKNELGLIGKRFNKMSKNIEELMEKNLAIEEEKRKLEMEALQAQINPHFLYNALNTLKWIAVIKNETGIADGMTSLGSMLRPIFKDRSLTVTINDEVEYIKNYLAIMNIRYGEGVQVLFDIPDDLKELTILRFILQPVVENSFLHGMTSRNYVGVITIRARKDNGDVKIIVEDNGTGIREEKLEEIRTSLAGSGSPGGSIGLLNVHRRIKIQYGEPYGLDIANTGDGADSGARVTITIPAVKKS